MATADFSPDEAGFEMTERMQREKSASSYAKTTADFSPDKAGFEMTN
jgi:hypothetical protein